MAKRNELPLTDSLIEAMLKIGALSSGVESIQYGEWCEREAEYLAALIPVAAWLERHQMVDISKLTSLESVKDLVKTGVDKFGAIFGTIAAPLIRFLFTLPGSGNITDNRAVEHFGYITMQLHVLMGGTHWESDLPAVAT